MGERAQFSERAYQRSEDASVEAFLMEKGVDCKTIAASLTYYKNDIGIVRDFARLAYELRDHLHEYELVLSDDVSGRLPARAFWKLISAVREQRDMPRALLRGFAGGKGVGNRADAIISAIQGYLNEISREGRVLLASETMATGRGLLVADRVLHASGHPYDIGVMHPAPFANMHKFIARVFRLSTRSVLEGARYGRNNWRMNMPFYSDTAAGLTKVRGQKNPHARREPFSDPVKMEAARADMDTIANALAAMFR